MNIEDKYELLALHRALFEAKFNPNPNDLDIAGSPLVAKLANEVIENLELLDDQSWDDWRIAEVHTERLENLIISLKRQYVPESFPDSSKRELVINALAPLVATEDTIQHIIKSVYG